MKRIFTFVVFAAALASLALGQMGEKQEKATGSGKASVEQSLKKLEHEWVDATVKMDTATLDRILADDWVAQGPMGPASKAEVLADIKPGNEKLESINLGDMKVRVFGDTAVVLGSDDEKSSYKGKDTSGHYLWMDVFVKRNGHWQAVASNSTVVNK